MSFNNTGSFPAQIVPSQKKLALKTNYLDFTGTTTGNDNNFAQQYLPELYEAEVERYGNRTLSGFLRMVGAEMPMTSDQVVWSEQNRLHIAYDDATASGAAGAQKIKVNNIGTTNATDTQSANVAIRTGQTVLVSDKATGLITQKALVVKSPFDASPSNADEIEVVTYDKTTWSTGLLSAAVKIFVYGSDFGKGTQSMEGAIQPNFTQFSNNPVILKDHFEINGSDTAQIGWVEVATEDGTSGYLWYLKSESETRLRFDDYLEMMMVESEKSGHRFNYSGATVTSGIEVSGSEGLFAAIEDRGNVYSGFAGAASPGAGALGDFDAILQQLDKQGAIEENMLFLSRSTALDFDDMIAAQAGGGFGSTASASYGLFDNEQEMALNFGFSGFRRGSYDFYKTDWKYLNDATTRGMSNAIDGVMIPAGTTTVYDQSMGSNIRRPFLHVRYRASETEDRRYKSWITGSVGGAYTSGLDAMEVHFLSERCLVTQAANNFVLFKGA
jgi:hypothetical protein